MIYISFVIVSQILWSCYPLGPRMPYWYEDDLWEPNHFVLLLKDLVNHQVTDSATEKLETSSIAMASLQEKNCIEEKEVTNCQTWINYAKEQLSKDSGHPMTPQKEEDCDASEKKPKARLKWTPVAEIFQKLNNPNCQVLDQVPPGVKTNVTYIVNHGNMPNFNQGCDFDHPGDDKGSYEAGTSKTYVYQIEAAKLTFRSRMHFLVKKKVITDRDGNPLEPSGYQEYIGVKQQHKKLLENPKYSKKYTYILLAPDSYTDKEVNKFDIRERCFIEYQGQDLHEGSSTLPHGNAKNKANPYHKTPTQVKRKLQEMVQAGKESKEIFDTLYNPNDPSESVRDWKQIKNFEHQLRKQLGLPGNPADDIMKLVREHSLGKCDYMKDVFWLPGEDKPFISCWKNWQLKHIAYACSKANPKPGIFSIDTTFNMGKVKVTPTCYTDWRIIGSSDSKPKTIIGPVLFHIRSTIEAIARFLFAVRLQMGDVPIFIGSDQEQAIRAAAKIAFPNAILVLCVRHLENNARDHFVRGLDPKLVNRTIIYIFGKDGMTTALSVEVFELRKSKVDPTYFTGNYFEDLSEKIWLFVVTPRIICPSIPPNWKTNISESLNNLLKVST